MVASLEFFRLSNMLVVKFVVKSKIFGQTSNHNGSYHSLKGQYLQLLLSITSGTASDMSKLEIREKEEKKLVRWSHPSLVRLKSSALERLVIEDD